MRNNKNRILFVAMLVLAGGYLAATKGRQSTQAAVDLLYTNAVESDMVPEEGTTMALPLAVDAAPKKTAAGTTTAAADGDGIGAGSAVPTQQMEGLDDVRRDEAEFKKALEKPAAHNKEKLASCNQVHRNHEKLLDKTVISQ
jgi:hypothetical protein